MNAKYKSSAFILTTILTLIFSISLVLKSSSLLGFLSFVSLALGPLLVNMRLALTLDTKISQLVLSAGSMLYAGWFALVYMSVFYWHVDDHSAISLIYVGICSLPIMIPIWIAAIVATKSIK